MSRDLTLVGSSCAYKTSYSEQQHIYSGCFLPCFTFRDLSAELLQMIPDNHILLAKLCAFYPGSAAEINQLHERVSGQSLTD